MFDALGEFWICWPHMSGWAGPKEEGTSGLERPLQAEIWEPSVTPQSRAIGTGGSSFSESPKQNRFCSFSSLFCPSFPTSPHSFSPPSASHPGSAFQNHPFYDLYPSLVGMSRLLSVWQTAEMRFKHVWLHVTKGLCKAHLSARAPKMHLVLFSLLFPAYEEDNFCLKMAPLKELSMPLVPITIEIKVSRPSLSK